MDRPEPEEQKKLVKEIMSEVELKFGEFWYIIPFRWYRLWAEYVGYDDEQKGNTQPPIIDGTELLDEKGRLRIHLQENYDYYPVPTSVGELFLKW
jgi:hypothetical protein